MFQPSRTARYYYLRFLRLKGDPHTLARGIAIGVFIGVTPTLPLHTVLILTLAFLLRGNAIAGILSGWIVCNPFTILPQYYFCWKVGSWLTQTDLSWSRIHQVIVLLTSGAGFQESIAAVAQLSGEAIATLLLGGFLLAIPSTFVGYFLSFYFFRTVREKRREKHILK